MMGWITKRRLQTGGGTTCLKPSANRNHRVNLARIRALTMHGAGLPRQSKRCCPVTR
jgi:hypothetical protein